MIQVTVTTIVFGLPQGQRTSHVTVSLPEAMLTLRDLITHKVEREVAEVDACQRLGLSGEYLTPEALILASDALQPGSVEDEVQRAHRAFIAREFMIVIDNRRVWDIDTMIHIRPEIQIEFIKILPLVGG